MSINVVVTGAARGIGREIAKRCLARGDNVLAVDIDAEPLAELNQYASAGQFFTQALDVRDAAAWNALLQQVPDQWGTLDILFNVAGVIRPGWINNSMAVDVDYHFDINTKGTIYGSQIAAGIMTEQGHGHIVNVSSLAGIAAVPGLALYSASKFAVRGFSLALAAELADHNVKVSVICPDVVDTNMLTAQLDYEEETALTFSGNKVLTVDDVCDAVFLRALKHGDAQVCIPESRGRLALLNNIAPSVTTRLLKALTRKGQKNKAKLRESRS